MTAENWYFILNVIGALIGCIGSCVYAFRIWRKKESANLATWMIVFFLDWIGLYLADATGNHEPYIQLGWCFAATMILTATWVRKGEWKWAVTDACVIWLCTISIYVWVWYGSVLVSLLGYIAAVLMSAWPQVKDYLKDSVMARKSAWIWKLSSVAVLFSLGAEMVVG